MCPHATIYVSSCYYICVLILLYMCPHTTICVLILLYMCPQTSICVLILLNMCPHTTGRGRARFLLPCRPARASRRGVCMCVHANSLLPRCYVSSYYYVCVLILLYMCLRTTFPCPRWRLTRTHTSVCVSSYILLHVALLPPCRFTTTCVLIPLCMCPHTAFPSAIGGACRELAVASRLHMCPHTTVYLCPHTTICVSSYYFFLC